MTDDLIKFLGVSELFKDLSTEGLKKICSILKEVNVGVNEAVFNEDDAGDLLYILRKGSVKIAVKTVWRKREEEMVEVVRPGEIFGEFSFIDGHRRSASAWALDPTSLLVMSKADFDNFSIENPVVALGVMQNFAWILTNKLRNTTMLWRSSTS